MAPDSCIGCKYLNKGYWSGLRKEYPFCPIIDIMLNE